MNLKKTVAKELWDKSESAKNQLDKLMIEYQKTKISDDIVNNITNGLRKILSKELTFYVKAYDLEIDKLTMELMEPFHFLAEGQVKSAFLMKNKNAIQKNKEVVAACYPAWKMLFHKEKENRVFKYLVELQSLTIKENKVPESEHLLYLKELKNYINHLIHDKPYNGCTFKLRRIQDEDDGGYDPINYWSKFDDKDIKKIREQVAYIKNSNINPDRYGEDEYGDDFNALVIAKTLIQFETEISKLLNDVQIQNQLVKSDYTIKDKSFYRNNTQLFKAMIKGLQKGGLLENDPKVVKQILSILGLEQAEENTINKIRWLGEVKSLAALFFKLVDGTDSIFSDTKNTRYKITEYFVDKDYAPIKPETIKQYFHKYRNEAEKLPSQITNVLKPLTDRYTEFKKSNK